MEKPALVTEAQVKELTDVMIEAVDELGRKISITQGGIQGAITPTSIAPTAKGMYPVSESGVYTNFKDSNDQPISITQEDFESGIVFIVFSGTSSAKVITPVPANGEVKEGDVRAVSGEEVYEYNYMNLYTNKEIYISKKAGLKVQNSNYNSTGFLEIAGDIDLIIYASESTSSTPCAFYDEGFNYISSISEGATSLVTKKFTIRKKGDSGDGHVIPLTAKYILGSCAATVKGHVFQGLTFGNVFEKTSKEKDDYFTFIGFINKNSGAFVESTQYKSTGLLKLDKKNKLEVEAYKSSSSVGAVYFYDRKGAYINSLFDENSGIVSGEIKNYPINTEFVRLTAQSNQSSAFFKNTTQVSVAEQIASLQLTTSNDVKHLEDSKVEVGNFFYKNAYLNKDTGAEIPNMDYRCTDFIPIDIRGEISLRCSGSSTAAAAYAFYDKYKQPVFIMFPGNIDIVETVILPEDIPVGATYIRVNSRFVNLPNPYIKNTTLASIISASSINGSDLGRSLKVMNIGSSHGIDMIQSFPILANKAGINIQCANLYTGGIQLSAILDNCTNNVDFQRYSVNRTGESWSTITSGTGTRTVLNALHSERWDIIILQRSAYNTNTWTQSQKESLYGIIKYITENIDYKPKILFSLGHPPAVGNASTPTLADQNQWYLDSVAGALQMQQDWYLDIIPTGTAVQNARSTFLKLYGTGDNQDLCRDLLHLDTGIGTYITGCVLFEYIIGKRFDLSILTNKYIPKLSDLSGILGSVTTYTQPTERMAEVVRYCAMAAIQEPYKISDNLVVNFPNE